MSFISRLLLGPIRVEHIQPPADVVNNDAGLIANIDKQLKAIAAVPPPVRTDAQWHELDRLFDLRNAIRPVPEGAS